jgi:predicted N-formylglutamate amidohydrolase
MLRGGRLELPIRPISSGISQSIMGYVRLLASLRRPQRQMCSEQHIRAWWPTSIDSRMKRIVLRRAPTATEIPLNRALDRRAREARLDKYFYPAVDALKHFVRGLAEENGSEPFVICMHSFARELAESRHPKRHDVCVFGYPEFGPSPKLEAFVRILRNQQPELTIGHDEPFSARTPGLSTPSDDKRLASPTSFYAVVERSNVLNHFALEICQDLISDDAGKTRMADTVMKALKIAFDFSESKPRLRKQTE